MRIIRNISILGLVATLSSCAVTLPMDAANAKMTKSGTSKTFVLGAIYFNGKYGVKEAAQNGKITGPIATVDEKTTTYFLGLIGTKEMIVTGE